MSAETEQLATTWQDPPGFWGWFSAVDHKTIGIRFIVTAFGFFILGGLEAAAMRLQLARPDNGLIGPDLYNQLFTMHGTTMMFLFAVPLVLAFGVYFVPLMIGARAMALPRLLAFGYWIYLFGGIFLYVMFALNVGPDQGWFSYVPLAGPEYGIGKRADVWAQLITFTEVSGLIVAICLVATVFKLRAPGMSLNRIPLFVWAELVTAFMVIFAMPSVMIASTTLILDRLVGTHFYNQADGGDPVLWQHLFWFFGHPEVYIIFLPAQGIMSMLLSTFSHRSVFGHQALMLSLTSTAFIGFGVWVHHMFATGLPQLGISFFTAASIMIVIPTGVQIFCWIATLWGARIRYDTPMLYALAFFVVFIIGGLTGVMLASVPLDLQVHDTFFVVAHLHYVLIGGSVFPLLGGLHYWFPKMTGRMLSERLGKIAFTLLFIGFNLTFFPQHVLGLHGMPRRIYTYPEAMGWSTLNLMATTGAVTMFVALSVYLANIVISRRRGAIAGDNPWDGPTLEWATSSPPPAYNFSPLPTVTGTDPLWEHTDDVPIVVGVAAGCREVLVTHVMDAEPDHKKEWPDPSIWPLWTAIATTGLFIGSIFTPWAVVVGAFPATFAMIGWFWPKTGQAPAELIRKFEAGDHPPLEQVL
jgi:cytochrome c oxidase subunit I+III